jgi:protein-histidine N-methyltransferase
MSFSFGFSGDDIEADGDDGVNNFTSTGAAQSNDMPAPAAAKSHRVEELVGCD